MVTCKITKTPPESYTNDNNFNSTQQDRPVKDQDQINSDKGRFPVLNPVAQARSSQTYAPNNRNTAVPC